MFYLRIIEEARKDENAPFEQVIENFELGNSYSILRKGITSEFEENMKAFYPDTETDGIVALLCTESGQHFFIEEGTELKVNAYFIMTESGKTFDKIVAK